MVLERAIDQAQRLGRREALLRLALELRLADEEREQHRRALHHVLGGNLSRAPIADELAVGLEAATEGAAQALLVGPALVGRDRIAIGMAEAVFLRAPVDRPLDAAVAAEL